ncbi:MAG: DUF2071 domain-containing protein [Bacteriovoracaceae bacterium]|nr:DUF2071 domain-containing protein [Bacteriovoracaceae bacterium]
MELKKLAAYSSKIRDLAYVTHAVPTRRLRRVLPKHLLPESFVDPSSGEELSLIVVTSYKNKGLAPAITKVPSLSFPEVSYQCFVSNNNHKSMFHFSDELGSWSGVVAEKLSLGQGVKAKININIHNDNYGGYDLYDLKASSTHGKVEFEARAKRRPKGGYPFENAKDKEEFFFNRTQHLYNLGLGAIGEQTIEFTSPRAWEGELLSFTCDYWVKLGLLKEQESFERFYCFLVVPMMNALYYPHHPSLQGLLGGV